MKVKAVIFDVDGVLVDTVPYHFEAWRRMFEEEGVKFDFDDYVQKVNGLPRDAGIKNMLPLVIPVKLKNLAGKKQSYFLEAFNDKPPLPMEGVLPFLNFLRQKKILTVAASSSKNAPYVLQKLGIAGLLKSVTSGNDFKKPKPDPEIFLTAAKKAGVNPENCVVVEDALSGVRAARRGGMYSVGLLTSNDLQIVDEAHLTVSSLKEYIRILSHLNLLDTQP